VGAILEPLHSDTDSMLFNLSFFNGRSGTILTKTYKKSEMKKIITIALIVLITSFLCNAYAEDKTSKIVDTIKNTVVKDYKNYYSVENLGRYAIGLGVSGIFANTSSDREIREWYIDDIKSDDTDDVSAKVKQFGDSLIALPAYLGVAVIGEMTDKTEWGAIAGEWGKKSLRAFLVGEPPLLLTENALGASRPEEDNSHWHPFDDNNSASGHSFLGAVSFLTAANMADNLYLKSFFYIGSTLTGLSRINDDYHYFSQSVLGWWMAYLAVRSIEKTEKQDILVTPVVSHTGIGIIVKMNL